MNPVGRYQIEGEIGRGATGVVYKALDPAIGRAVAIKTVHLAPAVETGAPDTEARRRVAGQLFREAQAAGTLSHPSIVTVFDVLEQDEFAYIVMELVSGPSLQELMREGRLPERDQLLQYLRQIAEALDYAHRKGIVHRDIKPGNVLIADAGALAKITDFGIAKIVSTDATQAGSISGTPSYMSPEQIEGARLDGRSDQFSLAVMVYEMLAGRKPFAGDTVPSLLHQICCEQPPSVESINPVLSPTVGKVLQRALAKKPEERFPTTSDFIGALSIALAEAFHFASAVDTGDAFLVPPALGGTATRIRTEAVEEPEPARRSRTLPLIVLLCFAVAAVIVFIVRLNSGTPVPVQVLDTRSGPESPPPAPAPKPVTPNPTAARQVAQPPASTPAPPVNTTKPGRAISTQSSEQTHPRGVIVPAMPAADTGVSTADVDLVTEPAGARIVVDGRSDAVCSAPCTMALTTGRHTLTAQLDGYGTARRIFVLPETRSLYIPMAQSTGLLVLTSDPSGAGITVDGRPYGVTPATLHLTAGIHHITVTRGLKTHDEAVNIEPGSFLTRAIKW